MAVELSVVVLSWNTADLLVACLRSLRADVSATSREIVVVDNGSADGSADRVAAGFPEVRLIRNPVNLLYSEGNNLGARAAAGEFLCLLNSDTEVSPGALDRLVAFLRTHPEHAMVGPRFVNPDGSLQAYCRRLPRLADELWQWSWLRNARPARAADARARMRDFDHLHSRDVEQPLGACVVMARAEYLALGGLDPELSLFFNDVDLCLRLRARGRKIHYLAEATVLHHHGASTRKQQEEFGNPLWHKNRIAFVRKHHGRGGALLVRLMLRLSLAGMWLRIVAGRKSWSEKRAVLARLRSFAARCAPGARP